MHPSSALLLALVVGAQAADFPTPYNTEKSPGGPMPPAEAAEKFTLPAGFKASVFAAEPDIENPIAMAWDARGRLWVAENYTYAEAGVRYDLALRDRIVVFEDKDGDGKFDTRKVFADNLQMLTSIEVGRGGVWAVTLPQVVFIPDENGDDVPDGPPVALLDGFNPPVESYHNIANGLRFGPDGWLYGRVGASGPGEIGAPGTPPAERIPVRGGMWRYHPVSKAFEAITSGNTNPWGHDWNEHGELFYVNTVNGHLWHAVAGAHFVRGSTVDPNSRAYALIDQCADHFHFDTGKNWSDSREGAANAYGGGHSHVGAMIYQGNNWPAEFHGKLFTLNQHGRRANQEILERTGCGYVAHHGQDTLLAADTWFRGIDLSYGPDGGVYVLDWSDTGECHERNGVHRTSGRIFKVTAGTPAKVDVGDLSKLSSRELVNLHTHANEWFVRQARLELTKRAAAGRGLEAAKENLQTLFAQDPDVVHKLRALWSLYVVGAADETFLRAQLHHTDEHVRTWAVRLLADRWPLDTLLSQRPPGRAEVTVNPELLAEFVKLAQSDSSGLVRLALASALQRLPAAARGDLALALAGHAEDANDHNLPLMLWYALIPVDPAVLVKIAAGCELPTTRKYIARRLAEDAEKNPGPLAELLGFAAAKENPAFATDVLGGVAEALSGWRKAPKPATWDALATKVSASTDTGLRDRVRELSVVFGDGRALDEVVKVALAKDADMAQRKAALQTLIDSRAPDLRKICEQLIPERFINSVAARGLATFDDPAVGELLVKSYTKFHPLERQQCMAVLVSRPTFAAPLLAAIGAGKIPRVDLTPFDARQIASFNDEALKKKLAEVWGELHESSADKQQFIAKLKAQLTPEVLAKADLSNGRATFNTICTVCHRLYGEGGEVGPDLTGTGRTNLDYLLENVVDPSAQVSADFRMSIISLKDGRVLNGFVVGKSDRTLTVRTMTEKLTVERSEITNVQELTQSLMPEGLLAAFNETQLRDLIAYLMHPTQVPLPAGSAK